MKEHGLIFKGQLIPALLDGSKTLTRRLPKSQPEQYPNGSWYWKNKKFDAGYCHTSKSRMMGFMLDHGEYQIGDRIWVRETFAVVPRTAYAMSDGVTQRLRPDDNHDAAIYRAGWERSTGGLSWKPSIHMPRWASRIEREIINVRVEQLQDITERDAIREGFKAIEGAKWQTFEEAEAGLPMHDHTARDAFEGFWRTQYGDQSWGENPWVYVIEFKKVEA